jgi:hypothetical protein
VQVPLLFMRVLGQTYSTVAVSAQASKRDVRMMIVVDRSGSVVLEQANNTIINVLTQFVATGTTFVDGQDEIGMVSFGGTWKLDFAPTVYFQSSSPNIGNAIGNLPFTTSLGGTTSANSGTNTSEGLYQAWYQLRQINDPTALNVILLLTDGRPSGFTASAFTSTHNCTTATHPGVLQSEVGLGGSYPFWPPPTTNPGGAILGIADQQYQGVGFAGVPEYNFDNTTNPNGCSYTTGQTGQGNVPSDITTFPNYAGPIDNVGSISTYALPGVATQTGYYNNFGNSTNNPESVRYAAFNVADNIATLIRQDTVIKPVLFVVGLSYSNNGTEPLDSDWLARVANDPGYTVQNTDTDAGTVAGGSVYQSTQTAGWFVPAQCTSLPCNASGLQAAFANVATQILRLSQ